MIFSQKNTLKDGISGIIEKDDIYPRKYDISSDRKLKVNKKVYFYKKVPVTLCIFFGDLYRCYRECKYYFPIKIPRKLNT